MSETCKNCGTPTSSKFCHECGQSIKTHELNFHFLWHDIQHGFLHFDKGIFYTLKQLFTRGGVSIKEFIDGKRVNHFRPISMVVLLASISTFIYHYINFDDLYALMKVNNTTTQKFSGLQQRIEAAYKSAMDWYTAHQAIVALLTLPFYSLFTILAFGRKKYNYVQHFVMNAYVTSMQLFIRIIFAIPLLFYKSLTYFMVVSSLGSIISFGILIYMLFTFFNHLSVGRRIGGFAIIGGIMLLIFILFIIALGFYVGYTEKHLIK